MKAMWNRIDLKERAKNVLRGCFWSAVVVALITGILTGSFSGGSSGRGQVQETTYNSIQDNGGNMVGSATDLIFENARQPQNILARIAGMGFGVVILGIGVTMVLFGFAFGVLVGNPIQVGSSRFFMQARETSTGIGEVFYAFRQKEFWNVVLIMFVMNVKIFLWGLLFVIPGMVKSYEYKMIPYILAENPGLSMSRVFELSREMTMNEKMDMFVLNLSFIPWFILSACTCGLAGIFWVNPYMSATEAELYAVLRQKVQDSGFSDRYELPGFGAEQPIF